MFGFPVIFIEYVWGKIKYVKKQSPQAGFAHRWGENDKD